MWDKPEKNFSRFNIIKAKNEGFSIAEVMIALLVLSAVLAVTMPILIQSPWTKNGFDKYAASCVLGNATDIGYNPASGNTTMPPSTSSQCYRAITNCVNGRTQSLNTLAWYASNGTSNQQYAANVALRAACDQGATAACDYFVNTCVTQGSPNPPYCHNQNYFDITYYLNLLPGTSNKGLAYIINRLQKQFPQIITSLINELTNDCSNNSADAACTVMSPQNIVNACNQNIMAAC